jgi:hypothetical protein
MEFFLYAVLIFLAILIARHYLRAYSFSSCLLIIAEIGILIFFRRACTIKRFTPLR